MQPALRGRLASKARWVGSMSLPQPSLSGRRPRTTEWKRRARQKFWVEHGEKLRVLLIGGVVAVVVSAVAALVIH
jgi:hypothetical protein